MIVLSIGLAFALWSLGLLALGLRMTFELPWRGVVGALALAAVIVAAIAVVALRALTVQASGPCLPDVQAPRETLSPADAGHRAPSSASNAASSSTGIP